MNSMAYLTMFHFVELKEETRFCVSSRVGLLPDTQYENIPYQGFLAFLQICTSGLLPQGLGGTLFQIHNYSQRLLHLCLIIFLHNRFNHTTNVSTEW